MQRLRRLVLMAAIITAVPSALAGQIMLGEWKRTTETKISDPGGVMFRLDARFVKALRARSEGTKIVFYCVRPEDLKGTIQLPGSPECTVGATEASGPKLSADFQCTGDAPGRGHTSVTYDGVGHYTGNSFYRANASGLIWRSEFTGGWVGDTC